MTLITMTPQQAAWRVWAADVRDGRLPGDPGLARALIDLLDAALGLQRPELDTSIRMLIDRLLQAGAPLPTLPS
jgi:hypothetical protein